MRLNIRHQIPDIFIILLGNRKKSSFAAAGYSALFSVKMIKPNVAALEFAAWGYFESFKGRF